MINKKEIEDIFKKEEKEIKCWLFFGFIGLHHYKKENYIKFSIYIILVLTFFVSMFYFGSSLFNNIFAMSSDLDLTNYKTNTDIASMASGIDLLKDLIPIKEGVIALLSISLIFIFWFYDLFEIEKRYNKEKSIYCRIKNAKKPKKMFVMYLFCIFLGTFGAHRFYLNKYYTASAMLILSLFPFPMSLILMICFFYDSVTIYKEVLKDNKNIYINELKKREKAS